MPNQFGMDTAMNDENRPIESNLKSSKKRKSACDDSFTKSRSSTRYIYLYEKSIERFPLKKLPSNAEVFQRLFNVIIFHEKKSIRECVKQVTNELVQLWNKSSIPTLDVDKVEKRIAQMYNDWLLIKTDHEDPNVDRDEMKGREVEYKSTFDDLFDIAHPNAVQLMENDEDIKFLNCQRSKGRIGFISTKVETNDE